VVQLQLQQWTRLLLWAAKIWERSSNDRLDEAREAAIPMCVPCLFADLERQRNKKRKTKIAESVACYPELLHSWARRGGGDSRDGEILNAAGVGVTQNFSREMYVCMVEGAIASYYKNNK
jgi:hypothetical protein